MLCVRNLSVLPLIGSLAISLLGNAGCQSQAVAKYHCEACVDEGVARPDVWYVIVQGRSLWGGETYRRQSVTQQEWEATQVAKR